MRSVAHSLLLALAMIGIMGCGAFLPLDEEGVPRVRVVRFDPSPVAPQWNQQFQQIVFPMSLIYVANYSQVPVTLERYLVRYFEAVPGGGIANSDLDNEGMTTIFVPGVPTPDPYIPDSTATGQVSAIGFGGLQILTPKVYERISRGTSDYADDLDMYAVVTLWGKTDSEIEVEIQGAVAISSLVQVEG